MFNLQVRELVSAVKGNPIPLPTLGHSSGKSPRSQRMTTATEIFCRDSVVKNINPFGGEIACLIQHACIATFALDDDDGVGRSASFQVYSHRTSANKDKLTALAKHQP